MAEPHQASAPEEPKAKKIVVVEEKVAEKDAKKTEQKEEEKEIEAKKEVKEKQAKVEEKEVKEKEAEGKRELDKEHKEEARAEKEIASENAASKSGQDKKEAKSEVKAKVKEEKIAARAEAKDEKDMQKASKEKDVAVVEVQKSKDEEEAHRAKKEEAGQSAATSSEKDTAAKESSAPKQDSAAKDAVGPYISEQQTRTKEPTVMERDFAIHPARAKTEPGVEEGPASLSAARSASTAPIPVQDDETPRTRSYTVPSGEVVSTIPRSEPTSADPHSREQQAHYVETLPKPLPETPAPALAAPIPVSSPVNEGRESGLIPAASPLEPKKGINTSTPTVPDVKPASKNPSESTVPTALPMPVTTIPLKQEAQIDAEKPASVQVSTQQPKVVKFKNITPDESIVENRAGSSYQEPAIISEIKDSEVIQDKQLPDGTIIEDRRIIEDVVKSDGTNYLQETEITTIDPEMRPPGMSETKVTILPGGSRQKVEYVSGQAKVPQQQNLPLKSRESDLSSFKSGLRPLEGAMVQGETMVIVSQKPRSAWIGGSDYIVTDENMAEMLHFETQLSRRYKVVKDQKGNYLAHWHRSYFARRWKLYVHQSLKMKMRTSYTFGRSRRDIRCQYIDPDGLRTSLYLHGQYSDDGGIKICTGDNSSGATVVTIRPRYNSAASTSSLTRKAPPRAYEMTLAKGVDLLAACALCVAQDQSRSLKERAFLAVSQTSWGSTQTLNFTARSSESTSTS